MIGLIKMIGSTQRLLINTRDCYVLRVVDNRETLMYTSRTTRQELQRLQAGQGQIVTGEILLFNGFRILTSSENSTLRSGNILIGLIYHVKVPIKSADEQRPWEGVRQRASRSLMGSAGETWMHDKIYVLWDYCMMACIGVAVGGEQSDFFPVTYGVKTGCGFAPTLFALYFAVIGREVH